MSYDVDLTDPVTGEVIELDAPHQMKGGTHCVGGTKLAELNITYNYSRIYSGVLGGQGVRSIYGLTGAQSLPILESAIAKLGDDVHPDYWEPTEGNAKKALCQLKALAIMRPDGVWAGD